MRSRRWCFTLNNYDSVEYEAAIALVARYLVVGKETSLTGTPHLQGFVCFSKPIRIGGVRKMLPRAHWEPAKGNDKQASDYCKKADKIAFERGSLQTSQGRRTDLEEVALKVKAGYSMREIAEEHPTTYIKNARGLAGYALIIQEPYNHYDLRGEWFVGPPGTGKSRFARDSNPDAYLKPQSKWFDGYQGEHAIILDDFDRGGVGLGHHLKIWTDRYACTGETKGGTINLVHRKFVVTSNYTIEELWSDDEQMVQALLRRFKVTRFSDSEFNPYTSIVL